MQVLRFVLVAIIVASFGLRPVAADEQPQNLRPIGGKWYVQEGMQPVYFYKDADEYVDLFSYHTKDSNKDGIPNIRLSSLLKIATLSIVAVFRRRPGRRFV